MMVLFVQLANSDGRFLLRRLAQASIQRRT